MKVTQIMTAHARCVAPDNTLVEAAGLMRELDVGALPVCEGDQLAGMVTDRDIVLRGVADGRDANSATVSEVMSQGVIRVFADQSVEEVARIMEDKQIRRVPVVSRDERLVGIVSLGDVAVTSNAAFSGIALKEVSMNADQRRHDQSSRENIQSTGARGSAEKAPRGTRGAKRPAGSRKTAARRGAVRRKAKKATSIGSSAGQRRSGKTAGRAKARGRRTAR